MNVPAPIGSVDAGSAVAGSSSGSSPSGSSVVNAGAASGSAGSTADEQQEEELPLPVPEQYKPLPSGPAPINDSEYKALGMARIAKKATGDVLRYIDSVRDRHVNALRKYAEVVSTAGKK